jgi:acetyl/propionyl-CoA carboxylase alpha subunit
LFADEAVCLGPAPSSQSYLNGDAIIAFAKQLGVDGIHPGYGFLSENANFAKKVEEAGITFIGPGHEAMRIMGSKLAAKECVKKYNIPMVPGIDKAIDNIGVAKKIAAEIGYPILIKASAGGGGKGMRTVEKPEDLLSAIATARSEAGSAFGDSAVYLERRITKPRHIEIQLLGDHHGTIVPFVERECSIQRRHQKVVEESPSLAVSQALRERMAAAAAAVAKSVGYTNAGTIEFLLDEDGSFYFLEMNTRLQVEHPVTEMVTDIDLVQWQIRIARGERLDIDPVRALTPNGHAIECRIYAEDPDQGFMPSPGLIRGLRAAAGPGVRDDGGVVAGYTVPVFYDSMIAKLVAWASSRSEAVGRMARALAEYQVLGIRTTIPFFLWLLDQPDYLDGRYDTTYLDRVLAERRGESFSRFSSDDTEAIAIAAAVDTFLRASAARADGGPAAARSGWLQVARREALRG